MFLLNRNIKTTKFINKLKDKMLSSFKIKALISKIILSVEIVKYYENLRYVLF